MRQLEIDIETPRLLLRRWQKTDLDAFANINADKEVMRYFPAVYGKERTIILNSKGAVNLEILKKLKTKSTDPYGFKK